MQLTLSKANRVTPSLLSIARIVVESQVLRSAKPRRDTFRCQFLDLTLISFEMTEHFASQNCHRKDVNGAEIVRARKNFEKSSQP